MYEFGYNYGSPQLALYISLEGLGTRFSAYTLTRVKRKNASEFRDIDTVLLLELHGPTSVHTILPNYFSKVFPRGEPKLYAVTIFEGVLFSRFNF